MDSIDEMTKRQEDERATEMKEIEIEGLENKEESECNIPNQIRINISLFSEL